MKPMSKMATPAVGTERTHEEMLKEKPAMMKPKKKKVKSIADLKMLAAAMKKGM